MTRFAHWLPLSGYMLAALVAPIACDAEDVVAIGGGDGAEYCDGTGPAILVGDGVTVGEGDGTTEEVCSGTIAERTFRNALCICDDYTVGAPLETDSFDSSAGPYMPGGTVGAVGINRSITSAVMVGVGGAFTVGAGATLGQTSVARDLAIGGALGGSVIGVGGNARVGGDINVTMLTIGGTLAMSPGRTISGNVMYAALDTSATVTVAPPCGCSDSELVDITDFVLAHRGDNDNALVGLASNRLTGYAGDQRLELPCGRYYLGPISGSGALTIRALGRVVILVDGDIAMTNPLVLELAADAELDVLVAGGLTSNASVAIGDRTRPADTRIYLGGASLELAATANIAANIYAPRALLRTSAPLELFGSLFVRRLEHSASVDIHYDVAVQGAATGCFL